MLTILELTILIVSCGVVLDYTHVVEVFTMEQCVDRRLSSSSGDFTSISALVHYDSASISCGPRYCVEEHRYFEYEYCASNVNDKHSHQLPPTNLLVYDYGNLNRGNVSMYVDISPGKLINITHPQGVLLYTIELQANKLRIETNEWNAAKICMFAGASTIVDYWNGKIMCDVSDQNIATNIFVELLKCKH